MDSIISIHFSVRRGGPIHETKLPMQELELNVQGGLCTRGVVIARLYVRYRMYTLMKVGLWAVHLTLGQDWGWADIRGISVAFRHERTPR